jgi:hypothetical protein
MSRPETFKLVVLMCETVRVLSVQEPSTVTVIVYLFESVSANPSPSIVIVALLLAIATEYAVDVSEMPTTYPISTPLNRFTRSEDEAGMLMYTTLVQEVITTPFIKKAEDVSVVVKSTSYKQAHILSIVASQGMHGVQLAA